MTYRHVDTSKLSHPVLQVAAARADRLLHDVYGMFSLPGKEERAGGAISPSRWSSCVWSMGWPASFIRHAWSKTKKSVSRNYCAISSIWPTSAAGSLWIDKDEAALQLYLDVRNPLVHELGGEKAPRAKKKGHNEPVASKWGMIEESCRNVGYIDGLENWNEKWPTMYMKNASGDGRPCTKLCIAALYWSVKRMLRELVVNPEAIGFAEACQSALAVLDAE